MLLRPVPLIYRKRRQTVRRKPPTRVPPVAPLVLVAATFDDAAPSLTLTFDRAIDVAGLVGAAIVVDDSQFTLTHYLATGAVTVLSPVQVRIGLVSDGAFGDPYGVFLNATAESGIVAVDDGGTWAGANEQELPAP